MAQWGCETWDENGQVNNKGIKPFLFSEVISLSLGQTGTWTIDLSPGTKAAYIFIPADGSDLPSETSSNRIITANANRVTISSVSGSRIDAETNGPGYLYIFMVSA